MPRHDYRCEKGHQEERQMPAGHDGTGLLCAAAEDGVACGLPLRRLFPVPARAFPGADSWRRPPASPSR